MRRMNKKQFFFLWIGILAIVVGGFVSISEEAYLAFSIWFVMVVIFTTGLILTFAPHSSTEPLSSVQRGRKYNIRSFIRLFLWSLIAIIAAIALIVASWVLIDRKNKNSPKWWLAKAEQESIQISKTDWHKGDISEKIAKLYIELGDFENAYNILAKTQVKGWAAGQILADIAKGMTEHKSRDVTRKTREYLKQQILITDDLDDQAWLQNRVARGAAERGEFDFAIEIAEKIFANSSARGDTFKSIVENMLATGNIIDATKNMDRIEALDSKMEAHLLMAKTQEAKGDTDAAKKQLQYSIKLYPALNGFERIISCENLAKAIVNTNGVEAAKIFGREVNEVNAVLAVIAIEQACEGHIQEARQTTAEITNSYHRINALVGIAKELAKRNDSDTARKLLYEGKRSLKDTDENKDLNIENIVKALAEIGYIDLAISCVEDIKERNNKSSALAIIAKQQAARGNSAAAITTLSNVDENNYEMKDACYAIAKALAKEGRMKILLRWAQSLWYHSNKANAFCGAADGLLKYSERMTK